MVAGADKPCNEARPDIQCWIWVGVGRSARALRLARPAPCPYLGGAKRAQIGAGTYICLVVGGTRSFPSHHHPDPAVAASSTNASLSSLIAPTRCLCGLARPPIQRCQWLTCSHRVCSLLIAGRIFRQDGPRKTTASKRKVSGDQITKHPQV